MTKLFVRYLKPYIGLVVLIVIATLSQVGAQLYLPNLMSNIVNIGIVQKGVADASQVGTDATQMHYLLSHGALMLGVTVITVLMAISAGFLCSRVSAAVARDLREKVFERVENFSLTEFDTFSTASLIIRSTNDIQQIQQITFMLLRMALMSPCFLIIAFILAYRQNAQLSWIFAAVIPIIGVLFSVVVRYVMPTFRSIQQKTDHLNLVAREGLTGVRVIRAFNRQAFQQERFKNANDDLTAANIRVFRTMIALMPFMMFIVQATTVAIVWFGGHLIADGGLEVGNMMAFMQYAMQVLFSIMMLSMILVMVPRASVSAERIMEVLDTKPAILDPERTQFGSEDDYSLTFDNVSFHYGNSEEPALCNINFSAQRGSTLAIIGSTGSGKSTLVNLALRLYDVSSGRILLNGIDLRAYLQEELHDRIGYVPQKALLFSGTIADNVRFGKPDASDEECVQALKLAQAWEFVETLPEGIYAPVSQGGKNFSGGQKQRLAIARVLIKRPEVYLFDDSFSALDLQTDAALRTALKPLLAESVQIIVAQRISTIQDADAILVIEGGRVSGLGTHAELLANNQVYREIVSSQLTEEEIAHA